MHHFYGLDADDINYTINDYLWGKCDIEDTVINLTRRLRIGTAVAGQLMLVTASSKQQEIMRFMRGGFHVDILGNGIQDLAENLNPDILLVDAASGIDEPTALVLSMADLIYINLRPDQRDFFGTSILIDVIEKLEIPKAELLVNQVPPEFVKSQVIDEVERAYDLPVTMAMPYSQSIATVASAGLLVIRQPDDPATTLFENLASHLMRDWEPLG
jgi:MinD-like ATPase involved in chromosome partitioning or flagellar assembly